MTIAREILSAVAAELRADPALAQELRELLGATVTPTADHEALYLSVPAYARRVSLSERTVWTLAARGLPTIGERRGRRVDVRRADEWMRERAASVDDTIERSARSSARRAARAVTK